MTTATRRRGPRVIGQTEARRRPVSVEFDARQLRRLERAARWTGQVNSTGEPIMAGVVRSLVAAGLERMEAERGFTAEVPESAVDGPVGVEA